MHRKPLYATNKSTLLLSAKRDITILIALAVVVCVIVHYSNLFQCFLSINYHPYTVVENSSLFM